MYKKRGGMTTDMIGLVVVILFLYWIGAHIITSATRFQEKNIVAQTPTILEADGTRKWKTTRSFMDNDYIKIMYVIQPNTKKGYFVLTNTKSDMEINTHYLYKIKSQNHAKDVFLMLWTPCIAKFEMVY